MSRRMWHAETPLHWAASTDDVDAAAALIDAGAHLEAQGRSIGGPLENAVGYECWHVARLLVDRGTPVDTLWVAAALGLEPWIEDRVAQRPPPTSEEIDAGFLAGLPRRTAQGRRASAPPWRRRERLARLFREVSARDRRLAGHTSRPPCHGRKTAMPAPTSRRRHLAGQVAATELRVA
jgi:hypothetical protein